MLELKISNKVTLINYLLIYLISASHIISIVYNYYFDKLLK